MVGGDRRQQAKVRRLLVSQGGFGTYSFSKLCCGWGGRLAAASSVSHTGFGNDTNESAQDPRPCPPQTFSNEMKGLGAAGPGLKRKTREKKSP
jgi:hypothetical protein